MKVEQIYEIVNDTTKEVLGLTELVATADNGQIVDVGEAVVGSQNMDNYVRTLIDRIGRVVFVDRGYEGNTPSVMMTDTEWGAITEKIKYIGLPEATENESWELTNGESYDPNVFTKPEVGAKFFSKKTTFEVPMSFVQRQIKSAFSSASQVGAFFAMIENTIAKSLTVKQDSLIMKTIGNFATLSITYQGIRLTYGMSIDYLAYVPTAHWKTQRGGTIIEINDDGSFEVTPLPLVDIE